jgi:N6-adenosine-specific RNA methylase IME4/ParB-like chromosome segregation protein Spo0J
MANAANPTPTPDSILRGPIERRAPGSLRAHPQAGEVPAVSAGEYRALCADINKRGLQQPLEISGEGVVLDGHLRLRAALELGLEQVEVRTVIVEDELGYILRAALLGRQLTASQRAALAAKLVNLDELRVTARQRSLANLRQGSAEVATLPARGERTRELVAQLAGTSARTVEDALVVQDHDPELLERIVRGEVSATVAASKVRRAIRDAALPAAPPLPEGPFGLILADPPWSMGSPDSQFAPEQHYPCMSMSELKALRLPAADDSLLFLWAVNTLLREALELLTVWGFTYRSNAVWVKNGIGPGVWLRQRHELLLIATRGQVSPPDPEERGDSVIDSRRRRHSEKPEASYALIEQMYPHLSKLELFARGAPRPGWSIWGNQADIDTRPE